MCAAFPESAVVFAVLLPHAPVLVPAVGGWRCDEVAATVEAMRRAAGRLVERRPDVVALVSPHAPRRRVAFGVRAAPCRGSLAAFGAAQARVDLPHDPLFANAILDMAKERGLAMWAMPADADLDHGAVVPLWFLVEAGWNGPVVVLSLNEPGQEGPEQLGECLAAAARCTARRVALVASGDMSHRLTPVAPCGFAPRAAEFDRWLMDTMRASDDRALRKGDPVLQELAAEDALDSILVACGATGFHSTGREVLSYEGPFGVGYGVAILFDAAANLPGKEVV